MVAPRYWTPEFVEAYVDALNEDADFQKKAKGFTDIIVLRCLDDPAGEDIEAAYRFEDGVVEDVELWIDDAPSEEMRNDPFDKNRAFARATAPYSVWKKLDRGEMSVLAALASPDYQIEGPKLKIMSKIDVLNGMSTVAAALDKTY